MAGDWIPMRIDLYEDPAVVYMAARLGQREEVIVGYLHKVWSWASRQCHAGCVTFVTLESLGRVTALPGFPELMLEVGWLLTGVNDNNEPFVAFPKWERWLHQSAKKRLQDAKRQAKHRGLAGEKKRHARVTKMSRSERDKNVTTGEERREENNSITNVIEGIRDDLPVAPPSPEEVLQTWNLVMQQNVGWTDKRKKQFKSRLLDPHWRGSWKEAIEAASKSKFCQGANDRSWVATFDWFLRPDTVTKLLEGSYEGKSRVQAKKVDLLGLLRAGND